MRVQASQSDKKQLVVVVAKTLGVRANSGSRRHTFLLPEDASVTIVCRKEGTALVAVENSQSGQSLGLAGCVLGHSGGRFSLSVCHGVE
jgi:hypothetical protein